MAKNRLLVVFLLVLLFFLLLQDSPPPSKTQASIPYNIILILTDDQRWDNLCTASGGLAGICDQPVDSHPMPVVETELVANGTTFANAYASVSLCCPVRASLLSGGFYAHNTNVVSNGLPNGGFFQFEDSTSLETELQRNGYKTALIGKYLNHYALNGNTYIPPGWDYFVGKSVITDWNNDYEHVVGSSTYDEPGVGTLVRTTDGTYLTDYYRDHALTFIDENCTYQSCVAPFFIYLTPYAPHSPAPPPPRHEGLFADFSYRERGYTEQPDGDLSDKPLYVQNEAKDFDPGMMDRFSRNQLASLRAVDEMVAALLDNLAQKDLLNDTVFIFAGDNGVMWGEHYLTGKDKAYEEAIRVPLVIRLPDNPPSTVDSLVAIDLDLAPTILELAGLTPLAGDGKSLIPLLTDPSAPWRSELLIQGAFQNNAIPTWSSIVTEDNWKYVEYVTGEKELYNLAQGEDPYELYSKHNDPAYQDILADLANRLDLLNRGLAIRMDNLPDVQSNDLPDAFSGQAYAFQFTAWGGNGDYTWSLYIGESEPAGLCVSELPPGLALDATGLLSGTPLSPGSWSFCVQVADTSTSPQPGNDRPQMHTRVFDLEILATSTGTLEGYVSDAFTGEPIDGASVTAGGLSGYSAPDGFYQIAGLGAGTYDVTATATGYTPDTAVGVVIPPDGTAVQDFALWAECPGSCLHSTKITLRVTLAGIRGRIIVKDENHTPIAGARVWADWTLPDGSTISGSHLTGATGAATFKVEDYGPGTYTLTITNMSKAGYTFDPANSVLSKSITR